MEKELENQLLDAFINLNKYLSLVLALTNQVEPIELKVKLLLAFSNANLGCLEYTCIMRDRSCR